MGSEQMRDPAARRRRWLREPKVRYWATAEFTSTTGMGALPTDSFGAECGLSAFRTPWAKAAEDQGFPKSAIDRLETLAHNTVRAVNAPTNRSTSSPNTLKPDRHN